MPPVTLDYQRLNSRTGRLGGRWWVVLLAVGVGAGVAGLAGVWWRDQSKPGEARRSSAHWDIRSIRMALDALKIDAGRYPTAAEGLNALIYQPPGLARWNGPYLKSLPSDPWGRPYVYHPPKAPGGGFVVLSVGPDGKEGTADDLR